MNEKGSRGTELDKKEKDLKSFKRDVTQTEC